MLRFPSARIQIPSKEITTFPGLTTTYINKVISTGPLALWTLGDASGTVATEYVNGWNGTYSNCTLGQAGIGDGGTSTLFNGSSSFCNVYSTQFAAAYNAGEWTQWIWYKVTDSTVWTNGVLGRCFYLQAAANAQNRSWIEKSSPNNVLQWNYRAGNVPKAVTLTNVSSTDWMFLVLTASKSNDRMRAYYQGSQIGTDQTGLGTFVGGALLTNGAVIGAQSTSPDLPASGYIAMAGVAVREYTPTEIASLYIVP